MDSGTLPFFLNAPIGPSPATVIPSRTGYVVRVRGLLLSVGPFLTGPSNIAQLLLSGLMNNTADNASPQELIIDVWPVSAAVTNVPVNFGSGIYAAGPNVPIAGAFMPSGSDLAGNVQLNIWGELVPVS